MTEQRHGMLDTHYVDAGQFSEDDARAEDDLTRSDIIREYLLLVGSSSEYVGALSLEDLEAILAATKDPGPTHARTPIARPSPSSAVLQRPTECTGNEYL